MANNKLQQNDLFPKSVSDVYRLLAGWHNNSGNKPNKFLESNNGVALTAAS